jgi:hypothetical protein
MEQRIIVKYFSLKKMNPREIHHDLVDTFWLQALRYPYGIFLLCVETLWFLYQEDPRGDDNDDDDDDVFS